MGTRGLTMVIKNEKPVIAQYGQWDHYPSGQGAKALSFVSDPERLAKLEVSLKHVRFAEDEELEGKTLDDYPQMSRNHGADILNVIVKAFEDEPEGTLLLQDSSSFVNDSLFCEQAYVIDLDTRTFEVYDGFQLNPNVGRFAALAPVPVEGMFGTKDNEYFPITFAASWPLDALPTQEEFENELSEDEDDDGTV